MLYSLSEASYDGEQCDWQLAKVIEHLQSNANLTWVLQGEKEQKLMNAPSISRETIRFGLLIIWDMAITFHIHVFQEPLEMRMPPLIINIIKETTCHH